MAKRKTAPVETQNPAPVVPEQTTAPAEEEKTKPSKKPWDAALDVVLGEKNIEATDGKKYIVQVKRYDQGIAKLVVSTVGQKGKVYSIDRIPGEIAVALVPVIQEFQKKGVL